MAVGNKNIVENGKGTQFQKGVSGNPNGRPKKLPQLDILLAEVLGYENENTTVAMEILMAIKEKALTGDIAAANLLLDRAYGKAQSLVKISGDADNPLQQGTVIILPHNGRA